MEARALSTAQYYGDDVVCHDVLLVNEAEAVSDCRRASGLPSDKHSGFLFDYRHAYVACTGEIRCEREHSCKDAYDTGPNGYFDFFPFSGGNQLVVYMDC